MPETALSPFEEKEVVEAGLEVPNAAGGLRDAMAIDPAEWHIGDRITLVLDGVVQKIRFDPVKGSQGQLSRVHVLSADGVTLIDRDLVADVLANQAARVAEFKEAAKRAADAKKGQGRLPTDDELLAQHGEGDHADELVDGCPACEDERQALADEAEAAG